MKFFGLLLCLGLASTAAFSQPAFEPVSYQTLAIGNRSGCETAAKMLITSEAEWQRVWAKHIATDDLKMSAPPVDWSRKSVVVLLGGRTAGSLEVQHIQRTEEATTIYYVAATTGAGAVQPFHFALVDTPRGPVRFADGNVECSVCVPIRAK